MSWQLAAERSGRDSRSEGHQDVIRVLVADPQALARQEMCDLLSRHGDLVIVAEAQDSAQAIQCARELAPDVVVLSMRMPGVDGRDAVRQIVEAQPEARIVMIGSPEDRPLVLESVQAGAVGYVPVADLPTGLPLAVRRAAWGEFILDTDVLLEIMAELRRQASPAAPRIPQGLDPRDIKILELVAQGATNSTIALKMSCSERAVSRRLSSIYRQLGVQNRHHAVAVAMARGWVQVG